jgi:hypothetical protein
VSLTLYRDGMSGEALRAQPRVAEAIPPEAMALRLAQPRSRLAAQASGVTRAGLRRGLGSTNLVGR